MSALFYPKATKCAINDSSFTFEKDCSVCSIMMTEHTHYQNSNTKIPSELKERKLKAFDKLEKSCFNWISNHYPRPGQKQAVNVWQVQRPVSLCTLGSEGEVGWGWDTTRVCLGQRESITCFKVHILYAKENIWAERGNKLPMIDNDFAL